MAAGTEHTMKLLIDAINQDAEMDTIMTGTRVYRDKVPTPILYPFIWLAESVDSLETRNSESVQRGPRDRAASPTNTRHQQIRVTAVAIGVAGDLPWKIMERLRIMLMDDPSKPNPLKASGQQGDLYGVNTLTETEQNLLPTPFADPDGKDLCISTQTFMLSTIKKGAC